jgi:hypothetical protein
MRYGAIASQNRLTRIGEENNSYSNLHCKKHPIMKAGMKNMLNEAITFE